MAGNSRRKGAMRTPGSKKGAVVGSGGQRRKGLEGKGPTPSAKSRPHHPAAKRAATASKAEQARKKREAGPEHVAGRNPVVECLRAGVPSTALYVALGIEPDERVAEAVRMAADRGISVLEVSKTEIDRLTNHAMHQGLALQVPPFAYTHPDDLLAIAVDSGDPPLIVALDGVTDPRNLGAVIRSAAAFGAHGVIIPQRRSAGMTAVTWRTSAGTAAKLPVGLTVNLNRTLKDWAKQGLMIVGLDADASISVDELEVATRPIVLVVGSEGRGMSRLAKEYCDETVGIPMAPGVESLNASVATGVVLAEIARRRRIAGHVFSGRGSDRGEG